MKSIRYAVAVLGLSLCAASLSAQGSPPFSGRLPTATFPSDHAPDLGNKKLTEGFSSQWWFPFSWGAARQMAIYESHDLGIRTNQRITHLGFQAEPGRQSAGKKVLMRVFMGETDETAKSAKPTFAANFRGSPTNVFGGSSGRVLDLPDLGSSLNPNRDRPFVWMPLDTPYTHNAARNLVVDYHTLANNNSNNPFFYYLDVAGLDSPVSVAGAGCVDGSNRIPVLKSRPTSIDGRWYLDLSNAPSSATTVMLFSFRQAAVSLPFLRPDCRLHLDLSPAVFPGFQFPARTNTAGRHTWNFPVPDDITLNDLHLVSQTVTLDVFARAGITMSNADDVQIGMNPRMSLITRRGDPNSLTTGSVSRNYGVISHFVHQ